MQIGAAGLIRRDRFQATLVLDMILRGKEAPDQSEVMDRLAALARGKDSVALDALVSLAQRILSAPATATPPAAISIDEIINALETHPLAKAQHKLLAIDLKIREHPDQRDALVQHATHNGKEAIMSRCSPSPPG
jgi:hypothetical protein